MRLTNRMRQTSSAAKFHWWFRKTNTNILFRKRSRVYKFISLYFYTKLNYLFTNLLVFLISQFHKLQQLRNTVLVTTNPMWKSCEIHYLQYLLEVWCRIVDLWCRELYYYWDINERLILQIFYWGSSNTSLYYLSF